MTLLSELYREALGELTDAAWIGACKAAIRSCKHFPVPAELLELAEAHAERTIYERVAAAEQQRANAAMVQGQKMLAAGVITEEQIAERQARLAEMAAETKRAIQAGGSKAAQRNPAEFWRGEKRRRRKSSVSPRSDGGRD